MSLSDEPIPPLRGVSLPRCGLQHGSGYRSFQGTVAASAYDISCWWPQSGKLPAGSPPRRWHQELQGLRTAGSFSPGGGRSSLCVPCCRLKAENAGGLGAAPLRGTVRTCVRGVHCRQPNLNNLGRCKRVCPCHRVWSAFGGGFGSPRRTSVPARPLQGSATDRMWCEAMRQNGRAGTLTLRRAAPIATGFQPHPCHL